MKDPNDSSQMTHLDLVEALCVDENIQDNIDVANDYETDRYGNNLVTMSFEGTALDHKKSAHGIVAMHFNAKGRLVRIELATKEKGQKKWQTVSSEILADFTPRFTDESPVYLDNNKRKTN